MNKVFIFYDPAEEYAVYVAAERYKIAKEIALKHPMCDSMVNPFVEIRGKLVRRDGQTVRTEFEGELGLKEAAQLRLLWWNCPRCESDELYISEDERYYHCKVCSYMNEIPFP